MERHYSGDIKGTFWFGVQPSNAPEKFGAKAMEPSYIQYYVDNIDKVKEELLKIIEKLDLDKSIMEIDPNYAKGRNKFYKLYEKKRKSEPDDEDWDKDWADLELGLKIYHYLLRNGECIFDAEL